MHCDTEGLTLGDCLPISFPMAPEWQSLVIGGLTLLVIAQWLRMRFNRVKANRRDELFRIVAENAADMIALVDLKGRRLYNSPAYKRILGYSAAELRETSSFEQIHPDDRFKVLEAAREARSTGAGKKVEYRIRHKDGSWRVLESMASGIRNEKGEVSKLVIVNRDITERKCAEERVLHNSFRDGLTGLANRRLFLDRLHHLFERSRRSPARQYALLIADLDHFRALNESMGSAIGDEVLAEIGRKLERYLRGEDTVSRHDEGSSVLENAVLSRMGGDEFTILLEGVSDPSDAMRVAERVAATVSDPIAVQGHEVRVTLSLGIALNTGGHQGPEEVLQEAETALQRAKALGGGRCELFSEAMHMRAVQQLRLEADLLAAQANHQFRVHYQPMVCLRTGRITGFEALLRWQHPKHGLVSPFQFGATAASSSALAAAGQQVIVEACRQLKSWTAETGDLELTISANVSAGQLDDARFVGELERALGENGLPGSRLRLELTETAVGADPKRMEAILGHLNRLRVQLVLDDFGTGNSSLIGLRRFPFHAVKIDRSLVAAMSADRGAVEIVEVILMLARQLKLEAMAEGIESAKQCEYLLHLGCEFGQGYLFSPPVDAETASQLLRSPGLQRGLAKMAP